MFLTSLDMALVKSCFINQQQSLSKKDLITGEDHLKLCLIK
jgi:hypothetical protein